MPSCPGQMTCQRPLHLVPGYCPANETKARVGGGFWEEFSALMKRDILGRSHTPSFPSGETASEQS